MELWRRMHVQDCGPFSGPQIRSRSRRTKQTSLEHFVKVPRLAYKLRCQEPAPEACQWRANNGLASHRPFPSLSVLHIPCHGWPSSWPLHMVAKLEVGEIHRADPPANTPFSPWYMTKWSRLCLYKSENSNPLTRIVIITIQLIILGIYLERGR
jgi:hypothetical protein